MSEKLTMDRAKELLASTTTEDHLFQHALAVSACMGAMARHFGADESYWRAVGICTIMTSSSSPRST